MTYQKPCLYAYSSSEIHELIGPAVTDYAACECSTSVNPQLVNKATHFIHVNVTVASGCAPFDKMAYIIPGGSPSAFGVVPRTAGTQSSPTKWAFDVPVDLLSYPGGAYQVQVSLLNAQSQPVTGCATPLQISI